MQELVIDRVEEKQPRSGGNPFYIVYGQNGEEITDFDPAFKGFGKGTRLNYEPKLDGSHTNFARWELIELIAADGGTAGPARPDKPDTEGIGELASIEARTAFSGIIELVKADKLEIGHAKVVEALEWASARLAATRDATGAGEPIKDPKTPFPHIGGLLDWCAKQDPPVSRADFLEIVNVKEEELPRVDIATAFQLVKDHLAAKERKVKR